MAQFLELPDNLSDKYGLSMGVIAGDYVFYAGMAIDFDTLGRQVEAKTISDEVRVCIGQIEAGLEEAGCTLRDVVKTTCWIDDESYRMEFIEAYRESFGEAPYPARTTFVAGIAGDCRVEIDVVAMRGSTGGS